MNIAIIPARSGSKGLLDKNIRDFAGKPLVAYSIEAAIKSKCFDEIMVSTDSEIYAEIARKYGASVPFLRSSNNSSDTASSWDMVDEVLDRYHNLEREFDTFCLLQPTSPLRTAEDIKKAYELFEEKATFAVVSVCEVEHSPLWTGLLGKNDELDGFISCDNLKRRQEIEKYFRLNGAIYIVNTKRFESDRYFYQKGSFAYVMPALRSVDIDSELDFKYAEYLLLNNYVIG